MQTLKRSALLFITLDFFDYPPGCNLFHYPISVACYLINKNSLIKYYYGKTD